MPYVVAMSESRVALAISPSDTMEHLIDHLKNVGQVAIVPGKASVSLVGENLSTVDECIATVCRNLEGIHIDMISHGASPINVTLVINENDLSSVIARLHEVFFTDLDSEIFE
jgi:aspartate kinase